VGSNFSVTLSELYDATTLPGYTGSETVGLGDQLFTIDAPDRTAFEFLPAYPLVDIYGKASAAPEFIDRKLIKTAQARCEVFGAASGDVIVVNMYYETSGDYRF
jgi:hypothetical protein